MTYKDMTPAQFCDATKACAEGRKWAITQPTMADVWDNCPQAEWLLWVADKVGNRPDDRTLRLFAVWCARNTPLVDGRKTGELLTDLRSLAALEVAERYADGKATAEELAAARNAAWDAATAARDATRNVALDAARAARATTSNAAYAARATTWDAADAAAEKAQADQLRTMIPNPFRKEKQP